MDSRHARTAALAALCVVAFALAAATLTDPVTVSPSGSSSTPQPAGGESGPGGATLPYALGLLVGVLLLLIALAYIVYYGDLRTLAIGAAVVIALVLVALAVMSLLDTVEVPQADYQFPEQNQSAEPDQANGEGEGDDSAVETPTNVFTTVALLVALLAGLGVLTAWTFRGSGGDAEDDELSAPPDDEPDAAAMGRAAGDAADRIEEGGDDFENEIYRAWTEMADAIDVDRPASSTPGEFADAAVAAGVGRGDVEELTGLFEDVRYGGRAANEEREQRAVAALRRIERTYADGRDDADAAAGDSA